MHHLFPPLPFKQTLTHIYMAFLVHWRHLLPIMFIYWVLAVAIYIGGDWLSYRFFYDHYAMGLVIVFLQLILDFLINVAIALKIFRMMLLGGNDAYITGKLYVKQLIAMVKVTFILLPFTMVAFIIIDINLSYFLYVPLALITIAIGLWLMLRFVFIQAAAAVNETYTFKDSWTATKGVSLKILLLACLTFLPSMILGSLSGYGILWDLLFQVFVALSVILVTIMIAVAFYNRTGWRPGSERA